MGEPVKSYQDLIAWQKAFDLGLKVHKLADTLPDHERFGLTATLRRTSPEIATDISRGYGMGNTRDYLWYLKAARGGLYKLDTLLLFAVALKYVPESVHNPIKADLDEAERVLAGLIRSLGG
jgi:four helix bundle protein